MENNQVGWMQRWFYGLGIAFLIGMILYLGQSIIIPFVLAFFIFLVIRKIASLLILFRLSVKARMILSFALVLLFISVVAMLAERNISNFMQYLSLFDVSRGIQKMFHPFIHISGNREKIIAELMQKIDIAGWISILLVSIRNVITSAFMVFIYLIFINMEGSVFPEKIKKMLRYDLDKYKHTLEVLQAIESLVADYFFQKTLIGLITAVVAYFIFLLFHLPFSFLWSFLVFVLNYIPIIGSVIATLLPGGFGLLQSLPISHVGGILLFTGILQIVMGYWVEPRWMGRFMNLSPLAVILSLAFWGSLWGTIGMLIGVPLTVLFMLILARFPRTRQIAILLSSKGDLS